MDQPSQPPERSGGIDFKESEIEAQDIIGRDKVEIHLPAQQRRGCYLQLAENVKLAIFLSLILLIVAGIFYVNLPVLKPGTPTVTPSPTATVQSTPSPMPTPTAPPSSPTPRSPAGDRTPLPATVIPPGKVATVLVTPTASPATPTPTVSPSATPTRTIRPPSPTPTPTRPSTATRPPSPTPRPPSPTPRPTREPTPVPCAAVASLSPASKVVSIGQALTVSVDLSCVTNLAAYQVEARFNPAVLTAEDITDGGFLGSGGGAVSVFSKRIEVGSAALGAAITGGGPYPSGSGTLVNIVLRALDLGTTTIDLSVQLSDRDGKAIPVSVADGSVEVVPKPTPTP